MVAMVTRQLAELFRQEDTMIDMLREEKSKDIIKKTERGRKKEQYASQSVELVLPQEIQNLQQL